MSLGGLEEIGALNCHLLYWTNKSGITKGVLLDCGQKVGDLPEEDDGFNEIEAPDFSAIPQEVDEIVAVFLSHGHLDHIGGINEFIRFYRTSARFANKGIPPILVSPYTGRQIRSKEFVSLKIYDPPQLELENAVHNPDNPTDDYSVEVEPWSKVQNDDVSFEFFPVLHSIPGSLGCAVHINGKKVVYTGDFKLHGLNDQQTAEYTRVWSNPILADADLLLIDSTSCDRSGTGEPDEIPVGEIYNVLEGHPNQRVFITMFSSLTDRWSAVMDKMKRFKAPRPVVLHGRSMLNSVEHVLEVPPLKYDHSFVFGGWKKYSYRRKYNVPDNAVIFLTGSQGEPRSALRRLLEDEEGIMEDIHIGHDDVVLFASRTIPGNEDAVSAILSGLRETGCTIYFPTEHCDTKECTHDPGTHESRWVREAAGDENIRFGRFHVSGHAYQDDLMDFVQTTRPRRILPVHADMQRRGVMADLLPEHEVIVPKEREEVVF
ncbi:MAG: ribonuclease J [Candidatus Spechtbacterales bacterium]